MTERRDYIGGATVPGILGISPWSSPWNEWARLVGLAPEPEDNQRFKIGRLLEASIAELFTDDTGLVIAGEQMELRHPDHGHFRGHIDGLVFDGHVDEPAVDLALGVFEAKTAGGAPWDEVPEHYRVQAQWYLWLAGLERCWFGVLFGGFALQYCTYEVLADVAEQERIGAAAVDFWERHVVTGVAPPIDGSEATTDLLKDLWPETVPGEQADLDPSLVAVWSEAVQSRLAAEKVARGLKDIEREYENAIREAMRDAEVGTVNGEPAVTLRTTERKGFTVEATSYRTLRPAPKPKTKERAA